MYQLGWYSLTHCKCALRNMFPKIWYPAINNLSSLVPNNLMMATTPECYHHTAKYHSPTEISKEIHLLSMQVSWKKPNYIKAEADYWTYIHVATGRLELKTLIPFCNEERAYLVRSAPVVCFSPQRSLKRQQNKNCAIQFYTRVTLAFF